ncbi:MAG: DUF4369 domain-containing protein [Candidatus Azobacteroides sp.]|nr:DUF4369 domain-containing protein [Candidatus Azobacteroides sp.]
MKKITFLFAIGIALAACHSKVEYIIKGTLSDKTMDGKEIYLNKYDEFGLQSSDTVLIDGNKFQFKGVQTEPAVYYLLMDDAAASGEIALGAPLLVKPGKITVEVENDRVKRGGNEENKAYQQFMDDQYPVIQKMLNLQNEELLNSNLDDREKQIALYSDYTNTLEQLKIITLNYLLKNIGNRLGEETFINSFQMFEYDEIQKILTQASDSFRQSPAVIEILGEI